jgi:uncharacterized lipoprotein YajG
LTKRILKEYQCSVMLKTISSNLRVISASALLAGFAAAQSSAPLVPPLPLPSARLDLNRPAQMGRTRPARRARKYRRKAKIYVILKTPALPQTRAGLLHFMRPFQQE